MITTNLFGSSLTPNDPAVFADLLFADGCSVFVMLDAALVFGILIVAYSY